MRNVARYFGGCWIKIAPHVRLTMRHVVIGDEPSIPLQGEMIALWDDERATEYDHRKPCLPVRGRCCHVVRMNRRGDRASAPGFIKNQSEHTASTYRGCSGGAVYQATEDFNDIQGLTGLHQNGSEDEVVPNEFIGFNQTDLNTIAMLRTLQNKDMFLALAEKTKVTVRDRRAETYKGGENEQFDAAEDRLFRQLERDQEKQEKLREAREDEEERRRVDEAKHDGSTKVVARSVSGSVWLKVSLGYFDYNQKLEYEWVPVYDKFVYARRTEVGNRLGRIASTLWSTRLRQRIGASNHNLREALEAMQEIVSDQQDNDVYLTSVVRGFQYHPDRSMSGLPHDILEDAYSAITKAIGEQSRVVATGAYTPETSDPEFPCDIVRIQTRPKPESEFESAKCRAIVLDGDYIEVKLDDQRTRELFKAKIEERNKAPKIAESVLKSLRKTIAAMVPEFTPPDDSPLTNEEVVEYILTNPCRDGAAGRDYPRKSKASVLNNVTLKTLLFEHVDKFEKGDYEGIPGLKKNSDGKWCVEYSSFVKPEWLKKAKYELKGGRIVTPELFWLTFVLMKHILRRYRYVTSQYLANGVAVGIVLRAGGIDRVLRRFQSELCVELLESDLENMDVNDRYEFMREFLPLLAPKGPGRDAAELVVGPKWIEMSPGVMLYASYGFFPSGSFITSFGQTLFKLGSTKDFWHAGAVCVAYGDDGIDGIRKKATPELIKDIRAHFAKFGHKVKLGLDDNGESIPITSFWNGKAEFLSMRGATWNKQKVIHCQRAEKIMANLKSATAKTFPSNVLSAYVQLAFHPDKKWREMIENARRDVNDTLHFKPNPIPPLPKLSDIAAYWSGAETTIVDLVELESQINGNNGEWTNQDDVEGGTPTPAGRQRIAGVKDRARLGYFGRKIKKTAAMSKILKKVVRKVIGKDEKKDVAKTVAKVQADVQAKSIAGPRAPPHVKAKAHNPHTAAARSNPDSAVAQGEMYAASLIHPAEVPGARVPDIKLYRTGTKQTKTRFVLSEVTSSGTDVQHHLQLAITPSVKSLVQYGITYVNGLETAGATKDDAVQTFANSNWVNHRCVSMQVEVVNITSPQMDIGSIGFFMRAPATAYNAGVAFDTMNNYDAAVPMQFDPTDEYLSAKFNWVPAGDVDRSFIAPNAAVATTNTIILMWLRSPAAGATQAYEFNVTANWEYTVSISAESGVATAAVMGSEAAAADAIQTALQRPAPSLQDGNPGAGEDEKSVWKDIAKIAPAALKMIPLVGSTLGSIAEGFTDIFMDKHVQRVAMFLRTLDDETFERLDKAVADHLIPSEMVDQLRRLKDCRIFYDGNKFSYCCGRRHWTTQRVKNPSSWQRDGGESRVGRYYDDPESACPACPPEFCVPASRVDALEKEVEDLEAKYLDLQARGAKTRLCMAPSLNWITQASPEPGPDVSVLFQQAPPPPVPAPQWVVDAPVDDDLVVVLDREPASSAGSGAQSIADRQAQADQFIRDAYKRYDQAQDDLRKNFGDGEPSVAQVTASRAEFFGNMRKLQRDLDAHRVIQLQLMRDRAAQTGVTPDTEPARDGGQIPAIPGGSPGMGTVIQPPPIPAGWAALLGRTVPAAQSSDARNASVAPQAGTPSAK